ncbi:MULTISPECIES: hypothetical protein [unclassified Micromonospora]|uniref:hypothetical protein n=1 Tax=unclassified Micromonospora TaxID=2617518 RepID=UPI003A8A549D
MGGIIPMDGVTAKDQANWAELAFQRRFNRRPVVSALVVRASTSSTEIERLQSVMAAASPAVTTTAPAVVSRKVFG